MIAGSVVAEKVLEQATKSLWDEPNSRGRCARSISAALIAYAAGDSFGVSYEYHGEKIPVDTLHIGPRRKRAGENGPLEIDDSWPLGGVSDDTMLSLLTIFAMEKGEASESGVEFLNSLRTNLPTLRGLGPTTRAALGFELREIEKAMIATGKLVIGNTNGGMMRTALIGLAYDSSEETARREMITELTLATHKDAKAVDCAVLVSRLYSDATSNGSENSLISILNDELSKIQSPTPEVSTGVKNLDRWSPPEEGISLDPLETLSAVYWTVTHAESALDSYRIACELGGDTDTVGALATGLLAARDPIKSGLLEISWLDEVLWSEIPTIGPAISRLLKYRIGG